jgi:hypothetical protein
VDHRRSLFPVLYETRNDQPKDHHGSRDCQECKDEKLRIGLPFEFRSVNIVEQHNRQRHHKIELDCRIDKRFIQDAYRFQEETQPYHKEDGHDNIEAENQILQL